MEGWDGGTAARHISRAGGPWDSGGRCGRALSVSTAYILLLAANRPAGTHIAWALKLHMRRTAPLLVVWLALCATAPLARAGPRSAVFSAYFTVREMMAAAFLISTRDRTSTRDKNQHSLNQQLCIMDLTQLKQGQWKTRRISLSEPGKR